MNSAIHLARRVGFGRNDLRRPVDRVDGAVTAFAVLAGAAIVVGAVLFGLRLAQDEVVVAAQQQATRTATIAVLLADTGHGDNSPVPARWTGPNGATRTGPVQVVGDHRAGTATEIWIDPSGAVVNRPLGMADVVLLVAVSVVGLMSVAFLLLRGLLYLLRLPIERWSERAWALDWAKTAPGWKQWR